MKPLAILSLDAGQLEQLRDEIHALVEGLSEANKASLLGTGYWMPPLDLCESVDSIMVRVELPGIAVDQIAVSYCDGALKISGEKREQEHASKPACYLCIERSYGAFSRSIRIPYPVDVRRATAKLNDGVLLIRLPKLEERRQQEIKIEVIETLTN
ncbi:MAG TPA: Hsp20/alpha crystallin family protein [Blastocatellia bacterium]|nr:Hsp20/alpha crystallin family protein [Blastocatellia bacterium]